MQEKNELLFRDYNGDPMQVGMAGSRWDRLEQEWELHSHSVICSYPMDDGLHRTVAAERLRQGLGSYGSARCPRHIRLDRLEQVPSSR